MSYFNIDTSNTYLNETVAYGSSGTLTGTLSVSFVPASAISSVQIDQVALSAVNSNFSTVSTAQSFPITLTNTGDGNSTTAPFAFVYDNTYLHADDELISGITTFTTSSASLSAGSADTITDPFSANNVGWNGGLSSFGTLTALGDAGAPSGVSGFTATEGNLSISLEWTNSTVGDVSGTLVKRSTTAIPANYTAGDTVYNGTGTSYNDTGLDSDLTYYYAAFSYDNVGNYSTLANGATGSASPNYLAWSSRKEHTRLYEQGQI